MKTTRSIPDFRLLFEASPDVLLVLLPDAPHFTMIAATEARLKATHTTREGTLGRGLFEIFPDNPDDAGASGASNLRASLERVIATRLPDTMAVQKYDIRGPEGTFQQKYWSPKNIPVLGPTGELLFILHRVEDVTELVQASELGQVLRDRSQEMEREVVTRSRELAEANRSLREANTKLGELDSAKTAFFSNVSHEFRTPLTLILGPLERALETPGGALAGEELSAVHRNALRLLRLVNSVLDFSRIEAGRLALSFAAVDLATLTGGVAGSFQSLFDEAGLRLTIDCPALPEPVYVDAAQWEKVVMNLVSNAFKFTFEGDVSVSMKVAGERVELVVKDSGTGIPEQELPKIFERFHRVEGARGRSFEGTGIGLSLVHELVRMHGGTVQATSELGRGTRFVVSVPRGRQHLPPDRIVSAATSVTGDHTRAVVLEAAQWLRSGVQISGTASPLLSGRTSSHPAADAGRLLVADDNADMRDFLKRLLSPYWVTEVVSNGKAALEVALRSPPDLVLSDVMMPEMTGVELLNALRADDRTRTVPVILVSARAGEDARLSGLETGADDYLVKPFAAREVLTRVRTHLEMGRIRRNAEAQLVQSAKMASLGELVAGIAHEINNPLAFVLGHLATVEKDLGAVESSLARELADKAQAPWSRALTRTREARVGLERIQALVHQLRTFSRLDEGELKRVSVRESLDSVLAILRHRIGEQVSLVTPVGDSDVLLCFASLFNQAVMNLIANAIDAIDGNGTITIATRTEHGWLELSVTDTGCGIPASIRDRVFEPFFTTKAVGEGTGLGLSITYSIAQKHGGSVTLAAGSERGTVATLRLPLEPTLGVRR
jgi:signal transduction histidine kinase